MFKAVIFSGRSEIIEQKQLFLYPGGALLLDRSFIYVAHQAGFLRTPRSSELRLRLSAVIRSGIMKIHVLCLLALTDAERDLEGLGKGGCTLSMFRLCQINENTAGMLLFPIFTL